MAKRNGFNQPPAEMKTHYKTETEPNTYNEPTEPIRLTDSDCLATQTASIKG